ncbi:putative protein DUF4301 [Leeuwenhoekiella aestuarii]|uniref:DUF4301 domain-containing protein n=1 Tax=Leeuwenhoekiella aestuarii TaxID=2249426 RepID=A0A4Q0NZ15_9FLAO|nr:DUF4301 family protein [Leeuwenhoekiella aestuarii]RXG18203.1 putative protein DUF4301 [Leeuwenhoekiella aestuarii]RXG19508.1 putative protein DUF4301 [Leeuwenhoekiella aestuarii]
MNFTDQEINEIKDHGLTAKQVESQIDLFVNGVPNVKLVAPATTSDGIFKLAEADELKFLDFYEDKKPKLDLLKFTPASGAASRMFKKIYQFLEDYDASKETIDEYLERTGDNHMKKFFAGYEKFPFYNHIIDGLDEKTKADENAKKYAFIKTMMSEDGENYGNLPKGLIPFHYYGCYKATAFEEHLHEAAAYAAKSDKAALHFTVSPEHKEAFAKEFDTIHASVSNTTGVNFDVDYSFQKPETDTVAVTMDNKLYRKSDGSLLFRPGGHGALIENLNDVDADVIFIKNIDNVLVQDQIQNLARSKRILAGLLLEKQAQVFKYAELLNKNTISENELEELVTFLKEDFSTRIDSDYTDFSTEEKKSYLAELLDRPMRVCGMVKNEGEPGGGPFWVEDESGKVALQIIESAQVNTKDAKQGEIFKNSTHFNPVDIVAGVRNYKGEKYNLLDYVNPDLAFIAYKTDGGNEIKALELPGLWNGAMARWNTLFVEVPLETFNPVKTVNDLLKLSHQTKA